MAHKFLITLTLFLLLFLGAGVFLWWNYFRPTPLEEFEFARLSPKSNFKVIQEGERKVVINEKDGLSFSVPGDWVLKEDVLPNTSDISIYSPDIELGEKPFIVLNGCKVTAAVATNIRTDINTLEKYIRNKAPNFATNLEYEITKVKNHEALIQHFDVPMFNLSVMGFTFPVASKVYEIGVNMATKDKERCERELKQIISTVSIKPKLF